MKMRQSLADIEAQFVEEIESDRERRERLQQQAIRRTHVRHREKAHKRGSLPRTLDRTTATRSPCSTSSDSRESSSSLSSVSSSLASL